MSPGFTQGFGGGEGGQRSHHRAAAARSSQGSGSEVLSAMEAAAMLWCLGGGGSVVVLVFELLKVFNLRCYGISRIATSVVPLLYSKVCRFVLWRYKGMPVYCSEFE